MIKSAIHHTFTFLLRGFTFLARGNYRNLAGRIFAIGFNKNSLITTQFINPKFYVMADLVSELNSLDFGVYIGGPLQAAVDAQNSASLAQVDFIQSVGFKDAGSGNDTHKEVVYVDFEYQKNTGGESSETRKISVPLLTMLNVPSIRIDEITIDFNAKLTSVETRDTSETIGVDSSLSAGCKLASLKVSASYKKTTNTGSNVEKTYSMSVHVRAVNDEIPAGLDRILTLLEGEITSSTESNGGGGGGTE